MTYIEYLNGKKDTKRRWMDYALMFTDWSLEKIAAEARFLYDVDVPIEDDVQEGVPA